MIIATVATLAGQAPSQPAAARPIGQLIVGTAIGLGFTPDALAQVVQYLELMIGAGLYTVVIGALCAVLLGRMAKVDGPTAFFTSIPAGPVEMAMAAERLGGRGSLVSLAQTMRIALLVLVVPSFIVWLSGGATPPAVEPEIVSTPELGALFLVTAALAWIAQRCGLFAPWFVVPLAGAAVLTSSGLVATLVPATILAAGQILLGISLGNQFDPKLLRQARRFVIAAFVTTILLIAAHMILALALARLSALPIAELILSTAPGSATEMALTAKSLHFDVALVIAYHFARLSIIIPLAPLLFRCARAVVLIRSRRPP